MADFRLPDSSSQLIDPKDPMLESTHAFDLVKDAGGSDAITIKVPTGMKRLIEDALAGRRLPVRTMSDFGRAALGHFLKHVVERLGDSALTQEWISLSLQEKAARYAKGYAQLEETVEMLAGGLAQMLERGDDEAIVDALEEYFGAVLTMPDVHRRRATLEIAFQHPNVASASKHVAERSEVVREAMEEKA